MENIITIEQFMDSLEIIRLFYIQHGLDELHIPKQLRMFAKFAKCKSTSYCGKEWAFLTLGRQYIIHHNENKQQYDKDFWIIDDRGKKREYNYRGNVLWEFIF